MAQDTAGSGQAIKSHVDDDESDGAMITQKARRFHQRSTPADNWR
jgi:hypothetical protein